MIQIGVIEGKDQPSLALLQKVSPRRGRQAGAGVCWGFPDASCCLCTAWWVGPASQKTPSGDSSRDLVGWEGCLSADGFSPLPKDAPNLHLLAGMKGQQLPRPHFSFLEGTARKGECRPVVSPDWSIRAVKGPATILPLWTPSLCRSSLAGAKAALSWLALLSAARRGSFQGQKQSRL